MQLPLQITFRHMPQSEAMEARIRELAARLDRFYDHIMSCRVVVEPAGRHHHKGKLYHVRIDVTVPGKELVVNHLPEDHHEYEDAYVSIRDAFDAMRRQLEDYARIRRREVKHHEPPPQGHVSEIYPPEDYGMITTPDGREIYFHRNSVVDGDFDKLEIGDEVRFTEEQGAKGPQASTVHVVRRRNHRSAARPGA